MKDKEKIRTEVERLMNELIQEKEKGFGSDTDDACILELQNVLTYIDSLQEEPVSEDLGEYIHELSKQFQEVSFAKLSRIAVRVYKWQKKQMMKAAVDGEVTYGRSLAIPSLGYRIDKEGLDFGDKVKLIIIKEK